MISSIIPSSSGSMTVSFSKKMRYPVNWVRKYLQDSGEASVDSAMVDKIDAPFFKFWFEQAVAEGDPL